MQQQFLKPAPWTARGLVLAALIFFCASCAGVGPSTPSDGKARALLEMLLQENAKQHAFNGAGRFGIKEQNSGMSGRILWMGIAPDKLRVEMLNPFGQPIVSASSDGSRVYAFDRAQNRFHTRPKGRGDLESILGISISVSDMVLLFSGRVPITGSRVRMAAGPDQPNRLEIVDFFGNIRQSVLFDDDFARVLETTVYSSASTPAWTAALDYAGDRAMPSVKVHDTTGREFFLEVEKFDAAAKVDLAGFVLHPPGR